MSPGEHNLLQKNIIEDFLPKYAPGAEVVYVGDALERILHKDENLMKETGLFELNHGHLPDVVALDRANGWLLIIEAVSASGHLSPLRLRELKRLLSDSEFPCVFVTAFPNHAVYGQFAVDMAWETEVWIASHPTHLIHYDGKRYLGPYED